MTHQKAEQDSKNFNTIHDILEEDVEYYDLISKSLTPQFLVELGRTLLQQRAELKLNNSKIKEKINNLEVEFNQEKINSEGMKQYVKTLEEECESLRNLMSFKEQESERRFNQLSEESSLMLEEMTDELKKQRQTNQQLRNLQKQIKAKQNQIRKLTITLAKINEENESLKQVKNINQLLTEQFMQSQQKLIQLREVQHQLRLQNQQLIYKMTQLEHKLTQTEFSLTQQTKAKQIIIEQLQKRQVKQHNKTKHKQNAALLKQIQNNFDTDIFAQYSDKDSPENNVVQVSDRHRHRYQNQEDFQNSLDNISENWDKLSLKEIQASSKSKAFGFNVFNLESEVNAFDVPKKKKQYTPIQKLIQKDEQPNQFNYMPLSIDRKQKNHSLQKEYQTVGKLKLFQDTKPPQAEKIQQTYRSVQHPFTPQTDNIGLRKHAKANSELKQFQNKDRELQHLTKKVQQYKRLNADLQSQVRRLQAKIQEQVTDFNQEIQKQIRTIERLATELKQQKIANIDETRKKDEEYMKNLLTVTELCEKYENELEESHRTIQHEKKAVGQLYTRLMEVQEERYQYHMNQSCQNLNRQDKCIQTVNLIRSMGIQQAYNQLLLSQLPKISFETNTQTVITNNQQTQTICPLVDAEINTVQTYTYNSSNSKDQSTNTLMKSLNHYQTQVQARQLLRYRDQQSQVKTATTHTAVGDHIILDLINSGIQTEVRVRKLEKSKIDGKCVKRSDFKQQISTQTQIRKNQMEEYEREQDKKREKEKQQNRIVGKQNWPIKKFEPTPISQEMAQQAYLFKQKHPFHASSDLEPNFAQIQQKQQKAQEKMTSQKQLTMQLMKLNIILTSKTKKLKNIKIPNLNHVKIDKSYQLNDIIEKYRDPNSKCKQYFVLFTLLTRQDEIVSDIILIWKEGLVSLYFGGIMIMNGTKKFIYDPVNIVLGNCEIIIHKQGELRRITSSEISIIAAGGWFLCRLMGYIDHALNFIVLNYPWKLEISYRK